MKTTTKHRISYALWLAGALALLLLPLLFLVGCKPSASKVVSYPPPTRTIGPSDVLTALAATNISANSLALPDASYLLPTRRWIESDFSSGLYVFQQEMGVLSWVSEAGDCDDFSLSANFYAKWLNRASPNRDNSSALAFGELYYRQGGEWLRGHAINFAVVLVGDVLQIVFYEPQTRKIVELSLIERQSVFFWKL